MEHGGTPVEITGELMIEDSPSESGIEPYLPAKDMRFSSIAGLITML
jgi:hypothetical protein